MADTSEPLAKRRDYHHGRWGRLRFLLGMAQMAGAVIAVTLLVEVGVTALSLTAVALTCALTTVSLLLFGRDERRKR